MNFIKISNCAAVHGGRDMFPDAAVTAAMAFPKREKEKPSIRLSVGARTAAEARLRDGEPVDIGIAYERGSGWVLIEAVPANGRCACHLHRRNGQINARLRCSVAVRGEWKMEVKQSIPLMPCDNVQVAVGKITARLPKSWERLFT